MKEVRDTVLMGIIMPLRRNEMVYATAADMVRAALESGKISADQKQWATDYATRDPEGFQVFMNKAIAVPRTDPEPARKAEIDETQKLINALFGIDDETFRKHGPSASASAGEGDIDETQRLINRLFGIVDETFGEYNRSTSYHTESGAIDEAQRHINSLCGVDDETYLKHNSKNRSGR